MLESVRIYEQDQQKELLRIVTSGKLIQRECRRAIYAKDCTQVLKDLVAVEQILDNDQISKGRWDVAITASATATATAAARSISNLNNEEKENVDGSGSTTEAIDGTSTNILQEELDHMASLERVAHATLHLTHQLQSSSEQVTTTLLGKKDESGNGSGNGKGDGSSKESGLALPSMNTPLPQDTEKAQFIMKLAPRIRALEKNAIVSIGNHLERVLKRRLQYRAAAAEEERQRSPKKNPKRESSIVDVQRGEEERLLLGHLLRSLALLGRGTDAESMFANVAIMPIIKKKVSVGKLDEGGSRGECAGLYPLLNEIVSDVKDLWGDVLQLVESIFNIDTNVEGGGGVGGKMQIDLVTAGVWVPIATALMTDPSIKMAIFSPGIANIFQANYTALDTFLANLASSLLKSSPSAIEDSNNVSPDTAAMTAFGSDDEDKLALTELYYQPEICDGMITMAQNRIYAHSTTAEFFKKWNLPIYYQLRFGEACARLEKAIQEVQVDGWHATVYTGTRNGIANSDSDLLKETHGVDFELPFFHELFDVLVWMWGPDVFLRPLTHRFLRGTIQILGRIVSFIKDGLRGDIKFGVDPNPVNSNSISADVHDAENSTGTSSTMGNANGIAPLSQPLATLDRSYCWSERIEDVATVSWELTVLEKYLTSKHIATVTGAVTGSSDANTSSSAETNELASLISDVMTDASQDIPLVVTDTWNNIIVNILTNKCSSPLGAVKGVAATYRMTNRPPPTQASPFVATILRPLKEFDTSFSHHTPPAIGNGWKKQIVDTIAERYATAISELIETVQRTEEALKNRKVRRAAAGGMSDGEKVRLQLFLDQRAFAQTVEDVGIDPSTVDGIQQLVTLTQAAEELYRKTMS